jgi:serine protease AprX
MDLKHLSSRTTRWGAAVTAALTAAVTAAALGAPVTQAPLAAGGPERSLAAGVARPVGWSSDDDRWGSAKADKISLDAYGKNAAELDPGSLYTVGKAIGARALWAKMDRNERYLTGQGVGVAVLDSGVAQVAGLNGSGKVTYGPDLSIEGNGVLTHQDTFGHGTFMAGIIAGRGTTTSSSNLDTAGGDVQLGIAPDAKLLAMKLANSDGSTDVSQVIAALDWVTQNPVMPNGTRVRVINLSYGTNSAQSYLSDPLAAATENAWKHGIVVVTSAGNNGALSGRLTDPAVDPYVIAVGATDNKLKIDRWSSNLTNVASFSQVGSPDRPVDLVAPGTSLVSLRAPGSSIDVNNPSGLVAGDASKTLFRGSGTSQAAAVVSGSAALLLQAYPNLTPDEVKYALTSSADPIIGANPNAAGDGTLDLSNALVTAGRLDGNESDYSSMRSASIQAFPKSTGLGSIDAARGGSALVDALGIELSGEIDVQGKTWTPATWWKATSNTTAWSGGKWLGTTWTGDNYQSVYTGGLSSSRWSSSRWSSSRWSAANWASSLWTSSRWSSSRWSSSRWSSSRWSDTGWL